MTTTTQHQASVWVSSFALYNNSGAEFGLWIDIDEDTTSAELLDGLRQYLLGANAPKHLTMDQMLDEPHCFDSEGLGDSEYSLSGAIEYYQAIIEAAENTGGNVALAIYLQDNGLSDSTVFYLHSECQGEEYSYQCLAEELGDYNEAGRYACSVNWEYFYRYQYNIIVVSGDTYAVEC